jgi:mono/diheme cytochrome c family protein
MKRLLFGAVVIVVLIGAFLIFIYSGIYDISAMVPHYGITRWIISTMTDNSVKHHAKDIKVPNLNDSSLIQLGFAQYRRMCVGCHGAPGRNQGEIAKSTYPKPPLLVKVIDEWTPSELFWITKNGIKMSGMPAFGRTHSDKEIWAITAFLEKLPSMNKEQYQALDNASKNKSEKPDHRH